jgi:hypothetical protein|nr:hypothetical protein [Neorhizobium tomejilense]
MMNRFTRTIFAAALALMATVSSASAVMAAMSDPLAITKFTSGSGLGASESDVQNAWNSIKALGTDSFLGGLIGNFKLDESSMIAGALAIGATEFDNFLKSGKLSISSTGLGELLSSAMTGGAGVDMSYLTGSFTPGGGSLNGLPFTTTGSLSTVSGGASASGQCDAGVASKQVAVGLQGVNNVVSAAMNDSYGFSQNSALSGQTQNSGFAQRGCLDKLFQNAGSDILFKPPSLGTLTSMLQGWSCDQAKSIAQQVTGQFGDMSQFNTSSMGGFFPSGVFGEANDNNGLPVQPGIGNSLTDVFGKTFDEKNGTADSSLSTLASVFGQK